MESMVEESLIYKLIKAVPAWALGAMGTLLTAALVLKIVGIDFAEPINGVTQAYVTAIERQAEGMEKFDATADRIEALITSTNSDMRNLEEKVILGFSSMDSKLQIMQDSIKSLEDRVLVLESDSHPPTHRF